MIKKLVLPGGDLGWAGHATGAMALALHEDVEQVFRRDPTEAEIEDRDVFVLGCGGVLRPDLSTIDIDHRLPKSEVIFESTRSVDLIRLWAENCPLSIDGIQTDLLELILASGWMEYFFNRGDVGISPVEKVLCLAIDLATGDDGLLDQGVVISWRTVGDLLITEMAKSFMVNTKGRGCILFRLDLEK